MRGLKKMHSMAQTHGHGTSMTNSAQWGRVGENGLGATLQGCQGPLMKRQEQTCLPWSAFVVEYKRYLDTTGWAGHGTVPCQPLFLADPVQPKTIFYEARESLYSNKHPFLYTQMTRSIGVAGAVLQHALYLQTTLIRIMLKRFEKT